jgi:hypothetical protein
MLRYVPFLIPNYLKPTSSTAKALKLIAFLRIDDCAQTWEECNDTFRACNHDMCEFHYPLPSPSPPPPGPSPPPSQLLPSSPSPSSSPTAPSSTPSLTPVLMNWGCHNLADFYADAVSTLFGAWAFAASNADRCECRCPVGTFDCGANCMVDCVAVNDEAIVEVRKKGWRRGKLG